MSQLVPAHGGGGLKPLLLEGETREEEKRKAAPLKRVPMTSRETSDLIMLGIGAFTPLPGFMGRDDWRSCCDEYRLPSQGGLFWPIPITLSAEPALADSIRIGEEVALWDTETDALMGTMTVREKYGIDKDHECRQVFRTTDAKHPGVEKVMAQGAVNLAGPVKVAFGVVLSRRCSPRSTSARPRRAASSRSAAGAPSPPCSSATPCMARTPIWPGWRSRCATASTSTSSWASSSPATSRPRCGSGPSTPW